MAYSIGICNRDVAYVTVRRIIVHFLYACAHAGIFVLNGLIIDVGHSSTVVGMFSLHIASVHPAV